MSISPRRPSSRKDMPTFKDSAHRAEAADAFSHGADVYDQVRPTYPPEVLDLVKQGERVVDIGCGTGILARQLHARGVEVIGVDPSADMVRLAGTYGLPAIQATAENTGLADQCCDVATVAQTWHWVDVEAASAELNRIITPHGRVILVWNTLDVARPWQLRLSRIMHSGDVQREGFYPTISTPWTIVSTVRTSWVQHLRAQDLFVLAQTRSYWLRANEKTRRRVTDNLAWYLYDRLRFTPEQLLGLTYRTDAFVLVRA